MIEQCQFCAGRNQVRSQNLSLVVGGGGSDPESICNLCLILKIVL
jgi:hypothetical protein